jgi:hypothetical protein
MGWSYSAYVGAEIGIPIGLTLITIVTVLLIPSSPKRFLIETVFGISLVGKDSKWTTVSIYNIDLDHKPRDYSKIEWILAIITGLILSMMPVLVFEGLFLSSANVSPGNQCPSNTMDCFVFETKTVISSPIASFVCQSGNNAVYPNSTDGDFAWCYAWVINHQTTVAVLNQLGLCSGLIGLFATIFKATFEIRHYRVGLVIVLIIIVCLVIVLIVLSVFKLSFSFLTFATLVLCGLMCIFGLLLNRVVKSAKKANTESQTTVSESQVSNRQTISFSSINNLPTTLKYTDAENAEHH